MGKKVLSPEQFRQLLGKEIKKRREAKEYSTYAFSHLINKAQPRVIDIEQGKIKEIDTYLKALEVLGGKLDIVWS